jgi:hypothetical protein
MSSMVSKNVQDGQIIVDDAARYAETVAIKDRMPLYEKNGLKACDNVTFSPEHKLRAQQLMQPS